ncbi:MAG: hypothetical protein C5S43_04445 [Candidatus Methanocomedens sp.]|nr:MAG: hypothetical protein C5S43_04445 [ANME-2 cluster archaeon]
MLDFLFDRPLVSSSEIVDTLNISTVSVNELVKRFEKIGILREITGKKRYKKYFFANYVDIISRGTQNI